MNKELSHMSKLRNLIAQFFSFEELKSLCFDMGINDESVHGTTIESKAMELVAYCYRRNQIQELIAICQIQRPRAPWDDLVDAYDTVYYSPDHLPLVRTPMIGKIPRKLTIEEVNQFLLEYPEWKLIKIPDTSVPGGFRQELYRLYEFPSYLLALSFINQASTRVVVRFNHHPRWQNAFNRLEVWSTTFNIGYKPSPKDLRLARLFEKIWNEYKTELFN